MHRSLGSPHRKPPDAEKNSLKNCHTDILFWEDDCSCSSFSTSVLILFSNQERQTPISGSSRNRLPPFLLATLDGKHPKWSAHENKFLNSLKGEGATKFSKIFPVVTPRALGCITRKCVWDEGIDKLARFLHSVSHSCAATITLTSC